MNSRRIYTKKINVIEKCKQIGIDKVIKRYEIINKLKVSNIKQCHLIIENSDKKSINSRVSKTKYW